MIDPANHVDGNFDVAVSGGKIAAVEKDIPAARAGKVVDVSGLYVTPGPGGYSRSCGSWRRAAQLVRPRRSRPYRAVRHSRRPRAAIRSHDPCGCGQRRRRNLPAGKRRGHRSSQSSRAGFFEHRGQRHERWPRTNRRPDGCEALRGDDPQISGRHCRSKDGALLDRRPLGRGASAVGRCRSCRRVRPDGRICP